MGEEALRCRSKVGVLPRSEWVAIANRSPISVACQCLHRQRAAGSGRTSLVPGTEKKSSISVHLLVQGLAHQRETEGHSFLPGIKQAKLRRNRYSSPLHQGPMERLSATQKHSPLGVSGCRALPWYTSTCTGSPQQAKRPTWFPRNSSGLRIRQCE